MTATAGLQEQVSLLVVVVVVVGLMAASCAAQSFPTNGLVPFADDPQPQQQQFQQQEQFQQQDQFLPQDDQYYQRAALRAQQDFLRTVDGQKPLRRPQPQQQFAEQPQQLLAPVLRPVPFQPQATARGQQQNFQQQPQSFQQPLRSQPQPQAQSFPQPVRSQPPPAFQQPLKSQPQPQPQQPQQLRQRQPLRHPGQLQQSVRAQPRPQFRPTSAPPSPPPPAPAPAPEPVIRQQFFEQPQTFEQPEPVPVAPPRMPALEPVSRLAMKKTQNMYDEELFKQQAENAKYSFSTSVTDGITDNQQVREEVRDGLNLKGLYSYSDGYFKRTVHYVADQNGYRVTNEEVEPLGDGPQEDPNGRADIASNIGGNSLQYSVTAADFPSHHEQPPLAQTFGQSF